MINVTSILFWRPLFYRFGPCEENHVDPGPKGTSIGFKGEGAVPIGLVLRRANTRLTGIQVSPWFTIHTAIDESQIDVFSPVNLKEENIK